MAGKKPLTLLSFLIIAILILSCGGGGGAGGGSGGGGGGGGGAGDEFGSITVVVDWPDQTRLVPTAAEAIRFHVKQSGVTISSQTVYRPGVTGGQTKTVLSTIPVGTVEILATAYPNSNGTGVALARGSVFDTVTKDVNIDIAISMSSTIARVEVTPDPFEVATGEISAVTMTAYNADDSMVLVHGPLIEWSIQDPGLASITPNDTSAEISGLAVGATTITATEPESGFQGSATVNIVPPPVIVTITPGNQSLNEDDTVQFSATVTGTSNTSVLWQIDEGWGGTVDATGFFTASASYGVVHLRATSVSEPAYSDTVEITLNGGIGPAGPATSGWYKFRGDLRNTGRSVGPEITGNFVWSDSRSAFTHWGSATVNQEGNLVLPYRDVALVNSVDAALIWQTFDNFIARPSAPATAADGTVISGTDNSEIVALDGVNGQYKWRFPTSSQNSYMPTISSDGTVYVGTSDGTVYALNWHTGALVWSYKAGSTVKTVPAIGPDGTIYFGCADFNLYAVDGANGALKWKFPTGSRIYSSPALGDDGTLYFGSIDNHIYAVNSSDGSQKWSYLTGDEIFASPAIAPDGTVYIGSTDKFFYALNGVTGALKWKLELNEPIYVSSAVTPNGTIYMTTNEDIVAFDSNGTELWRVGPSFGSSEGASLAVRSDGAIIAVVDGKWTFVN